MYLKTTRKKKPANLKEFWLLTSLCNDAGINWPMISKYSGSHSTRVLPDSVLRQVGRNQRTLVKMFIRLSTESGSTPTLCDP